ncbi:borealin-like [Scaptodrosophila lebanonensis]|uniref:Borealin-like n=1 Tax=Drosophila lebanonensis TaxID=7225 RepID=A0A6J2TR86_DROLE|nr:borealin-like [Scaptodrosophila lebanonensis]
MPRTKITKNSKRNREAANREEKIRAYEVKMDSLYMSVDDLEQKYKAAVDHELKLIEGRMVTQLREMKIGDFLQILGHLDHFGDFKASDQTQMLASQSICSKSNTTGGGDLANIKGSCSRNDEGYLTEDSSLGAVASSGSASAAYTGSILRSTKALRTPGPLHSARARRARRSQSAGGEISILPSAKPHVSGVASMEHSSRSKMRTPMVSRTKALSADRTPRLHHKGRASSPSTPPMSFLRWPKPGEVALSKFGSPMVAQVMPDKIANVNIPIRNGVLSMRPKKLAEVETDLLESLDTDTLHQIKTLHDNLALIMNTVGKAGLK